MFGHLVHRVLWRFCLALPFRNKLLFLFQLRYKSFARFHCSPPQKKSKNILIELLCKIKGPDTYIMPLTGKPEQQRFKIRSDVLNSNSSRRRGATSGRPLPEHTDFGPQ